MRAANRKSRWVIVILYDICVEEIINDIDPTLRIYLENNTYIKWGDPNFWTKLKKALRKKRRTNFQSNCKILDITRQNISDNISAINDNILGSVESSNL